MCVYDIDKNVAFISTWKNPKKPIIIQPNRASGYWNNQLLEQINNPIAI